MADPPPPWRLTFTAPARRDIRGLDPPIGRRMLAALDKAATDPDRAQLRKLVGRPEQRLRTGAELVGVEDVTGGAQCRLVVTIEVEGGTKPACVAGVLVRHYASRRQIRPLLGLAAWWTRTAARCESSSRCPCRRGRPPWQQRRGPRPCARDAGNRSP